MCTDYQVNSSPASAKLFPDSEIAKLWGTSGGKGGLRASKGDYMCTLAADKKEKREERRKNKVIMDQKLKEDKGQETSDLKVELAKLRRKNREAQKKIPPDSPCTGMS